MFHVLFSLSYLKVQGICCGWSSKTHEQNNCTWGSWQLLKTAVTWFDHILVQWVYTGTTSLKLPEFSLLWPKQIWRRFWRLMATMKMAAGCLWKRPSPNHPTGLPFLFPVVEPWVSLGLLQLLWVFPHIRGSRDGNGEHPTSLGSPKGETLSYIPKIEQRITWVCRERKMEEDWFYEYPSSVISIVISLMTAFFNRSWILLV